MSDMSAVRVTGWHVVGVVGRLSFFGVYDYTEGLEVPTILKR